MTLFLDDLVIHSVESLLLLFLFYLFKHFLCGLYIILVSFLFTDIIWEVHYFLGFFAELSRIFLF